MFASFKELRTLLPFHGPSAASPLLLVTPQIADPAPVPPAVPVAVPFASADASSTRSAFTSPVACRTGCKEFPDPSPMWFLNLVPSRQPSDARLIGRLMPSPSAVCCPFHQPSAAHSIGRFYRTCQPSGGRLQSSDPSPRRSWSRSRTRYPSGGHLQSRHPSPTRHPSGGVIVPGPGPIARSIAVNTRDPSPYRSRSHSQTCHLSGGR